MFELDDARRSALVESWAQRIVARGLATPAIFLLEAHLPLAGLGAQGLTALHPLLSAVLPVNVAEWAAFLHDRANIERLVVRIEELRDTHPPPT
jgi:hypothetical protein